MECVLRFDRWVPFMRPQELTMIATTLGCKWVIYPLPLLAGCYNPDHQPPPVSLGLWFTNICQPTAEGSEHLQISIMVMINWVFVWMCIAVGVQSASTVLLNPHFKGYCKCNDFPSQRQSIKWKQQSLLIISLKKQYSYYCNYNLYNCF